MSADMKRSLTACVLAACIPTLTASVVRAQAAPEPPPEGTAEVALEAPPEAPPEASPAPEKESSAMVAFGGLFDEPSSTRPRSEPDPNAPAHDPELPVDEIPDAAQAEKPKWYERIQLRGYTQFRYNRIPVPNQNDDLVNLQGDRTIGRGNGFSIRRLRLIFYGDLHEHLSFYIQPDLVSTAGGQMHALVMRDVYADIFFDKQHRFRVRLGQSKVPYGFENMQSSQNRLALDRNDALNSAVKDERDIGAFFYYSSEIAQKRFRYLVSSGLKGSGDYGVAALGVYNGQTANQPALSDNLHVVGRLTYPFLFGSQYVEMGFGGFYGKYRVRFDETEYSTASGENDILDARAFGTIVVYPQPFGFQAEFTYGVGPAMGSPGDNDRNVIDARRLIGGYAQVMYKIDEPFGTVALIPFVRGTYYDGGKKFNVNAPHYLVKELEIGIEWQLFPQLEVVLAYDIVDRTSDLTYQQESGHVGRIQVQMNYP
jgi:hypothetical protein